MKKITIGMLLLAGCMSAAAELEMFTETGPGSVGIMRTKINAGFAQVNSNNTTLLVSDYAWISNLVDHTVWRYSTPGDTNSAVEIYVKPNLDLGPEGALAVKRVISPDHSDDVREFMVLVAEGGANIELYGRSATNSPAWTDGAAIVDASTFMVRDDGGWANKTVNFPKGNSDTDSAVNRLVINSNGVSVGSSSVVEYPFQVKNTTWDNPIALLVDTNGNVWVANTSNHTIYAYSTPGDTNSALEVYLTPTLDLGAEGFLQARNIVAADHDDATREYLELAAEGGAQARLYGRSGTTPTSTDGLMVLDASGLLIREDGGWLNFEDDYPKGAAASDTVTVRVKIDETGASFGNTNTVTYPFQIYDDAWSDPFALFVDTNGNSTVGGALSAPSATYSSGNSVLNATALDTRFQNASSGISMTLRTRKDYQNPGFKRIEADESVSWMASLCHDETLTVAGYSDTDANGLYSWYADTAPNGRYYRRTAGGKTFQISGDYSANDACYLERVLPTQANLSSSGVDTYPYEGTYFPPRTGWSAGVTVTYTGNFDINARWYFRTLKSTTAPTDDGWEEFNEADFLLGLPSAQAIDYTRWKCVPSAESGLSQDDDLTMFSGYRRATSLWEKYGMRWQSSYYNYVKMIPVEAQSEGN